MKRFAMLVLGITLAALPALAQPQGFS